jgi:hypothetical protein
MFPKFPRWRLGTGPGLADAMAETQNLPPDVCTLQYSSSTVQLVNGLRYYVTVTVVNGACPEVTTDYIVIITYTPNVIIIMIFNVTSCHHLILIFTLNVP